MKRGTELIYFILDKLFLQKKEQQNFIEKNLLLRTLKIYFTTTTITTSVGWPTVWSSAEAEKDIDVDVVFLPIFATYDILSSSLMSETLKVN